MPKATVAIIGLDKIGTSIGLALKAPGNDYQVVGHDQDTLWSKTARNMGAVDSTSWNLINAASSADVIVLAVPFHQVQETLKVIGPELKTNSVVIDTSFLKEAVIAWSEAYLKAETHFIGVFLGTNPDYALDSSRGPEGAKADLFANSPCALMPAPNCRPEAVKATQDLALLLGATPHFFDPAEFDGLSTAVNLMPALLAAAALQSMTESPSWREMRRLSSSNLAHFSWAMEVGGPSLAEAAAVNKANLLRWLDTFIEGLGALRTQLDQGEQEVLANQLEVVGLAREKWMADWERNRWEKDSQPDMPAVGSFFGQLFGMGARRKNDPGEGQ